MVIKMENDFDGSTPTCEKPKKSFSCASHRPEPACRMPRTFGAFLRKKGSIPCQPAGMDPFSFSSLSRS